MTSFKKVDGTPIEASKYTLSILKLEPAVDIHIGTDSQNNGLYTTYSTVIAYRKGLRGVHYIFNRERTPRIDDVFSRLWREAEKSIEVAEWLTEKINVNVEIDMDYNSNDIFESNKLIDSARGWANSLGYKVNVKPDNQIATKAADLKCR